MAKTIKEINKLVKNMSLQETLAFLDCLIKLEENEDIAQKEDPIAYAYKQSCISPQKMFKESMKDLNKKLGE
jgi:hypothetical protein